MSDGKIVRLPIHHRHTQLVTHSEGMHSSDLHKNAHRTQHRAEDPNEDSAWQNRFEGLIAQFRDKLHQKPA